jgi:hypothetical protein
MSKLKMWDSYPSWEEAEKHWEEGSEKARQTVEVKRLQTLPMMPGITPDTKKNLKWKSLKYMVQHDKGGHVFKGFIKHPLKHSLAFIKSAFKTKSYKRENDFFLYGIDSLSEMESLLEKKETLLVVGFSYCHKPFECPSGRFTDECIHDPEHPVCRQCFIGKALNTLPNNDCIPLIIPTIHYIGQKIFEIVHENPKKQVIFIITACEMTLEMFGDWGNMVNIKGAGVRLDGRICNTMKAFHLSENGIKPGLTVVLDETKSRILELIRYRREKRL